MNTVQKLIHEERLHWRIAIYVMGIFTLALGGALTINSALGVSPINSLPYVLSMMTGIYIGMCFFAMLTFFTLLQIVILRREFKLVSLAQLPGAFLFGYLLDLIRLIIGDFALPTYLGQLVLLGLGIAGIATGITLFTSVRLVPLPFECLVATIVQKRPDMQFHRVLIVLSVTIVSLAILLSLLVLGGVYGVREGTVISAILTGKMMPLIKRATQPLLIKVGIVSMEPKPLELAI